MEKKGRRSKSMRGQIVDFDLMEIKAQIASQPKTTDVTAREEFIESRLNRRLKRRIENQKKIEEEFQKREDNSDPEDQPVKNVDVPVVENKPKNAIKEINIPEPLIEEEEAPKIRTIKKKKIED